MPMTILSTLLDSAVKVHGWWIHWIIKLQVWGKRNSHSSSHHQTHTTEKYQDLSLCHINGKLVLVGMWCIYASCCVEMCNTPQLPCTVCSRGIRSNSKAVSCDGCDEWTHLHCCNQHSVEIPIELYNQCSREDTELTYFCRKCINNIILTPSNNQMPEHRGNGSNGSGEEKTSKAANSDSSYNPKPHSVDTQSPEFYDVFKKKGLHFLHLNARSLLPKIDQVKHLATSTIA